MIEVELSRIVIDEERHEQVIVLKEKKGNKLLPIVIGLNEALAVRMHLSGFKHPRPLTHDLMKSLLDNLDVVLEKVVIDKLVDSTFHAKLYLITPQGKKIVDARPSDSIALAVRTKSPLFVEEEVFEKLKESDL
ncbi:MAG: bifunctional nuclease family protein [Candidatus Omnitrophota bacterium]|nr:MAG: bifunctional nuclease family protein [Candidatus Omnitrophota bacterium]